VETLCRQTLSVIIPLYNEERTLRTLLEKVLDVPLSIDRELVIVNDGSVDSSADIVHAFTVAHPEARIKYLERSNGGKGAAVRDGIRASSGDYLIIQDADLEYDPADYQRCIEPLLTGECFIVYGSRIRRKGNKYSALRFYLGGLAVTKFINLLFGCRLTDEPTCYKTFHGDLIRALEFENNDFAWEPEVTCKLLRLGYAIHEVPISYAPRCFAEGKKIRWYDGLKAFMTTLKWRFAGMKKFAHLQKSVYIPPEQ